MSKLSFSRRDFMQAVAATGAVAYARLARGAVGVGDDRIRFGVIGCGGMGTGHLNELVKRADADNVKVVAVSDVYQRRLSRAKDISGGEGYIDYRKLLERDDIDAVLIATPDHWHSKIAIDAMAAGKHVYVEKPMTHTVEQAIELRDAVARYGKVLQVGPQATGNDGPWLAREAIRSGRLGKVTWAQGSYNRNARVCLFNEHQKIDASAGPDKSGDDFIDWDLWLGHAWGLAPKIPWTPEHFFRFRKYWPYNGGVATDLLYHKLAPLLLAIAGPDGEYPLHSAMGGQYIEKDGRDIPDTFLMSADFPSEFSIFLVSTLTNDSQITDRIYGKHGTLDFDGTPVLRANGDFAEEFKAANNGQTEAKLEPRPRRDMKGNFIDCIRGRGTPNCNVKLGAATMVAIKLAVESYRQSKMLRWDPQQEKVVS